MILSIVQKIFEREYLLSNSIAYRVFESSSSSMPHKVELDKSIIEYILGLLGDPILSLIKFIRLGNARSGAIRPLKFICSN